jgi:hypothetical protein
MKHKIANILVLLLGVAVAAAALPDTASAQPTPTPLVKAAPVASAQRVLFLGNSLMYYSGGLQTHTHRIAAAATPPLMVEKGYKSVHITGAALNQYPIDFLVTPGNLGIKDPFEIVVLAGNSLDAMSDAGRALYRQKVIEFDAAIKKQGGRTALLWLPETVAPHPMAGRDMFARDQDMIMSVGNEVGAFIIPVGLAYHEAYRQRPGIKLQVYDGNHPSVAGQYLAACVVYASLYDRSPIGNPYDYFGVLDKDTTALLQKVAYETTKKFYGRAP